MGYRIILEKEKKEYVFSLTKNKDKQVKLLSIWTFLIMDEGKSIGEIYRHHRNNAIKKKRYDLVMSERYFYKLAKLINEFKATGQETGQETGQGEKVPQSGSMPSVSSSDEVHKNKDYKEIYNNILSTETVSTNELTVFAELLMDEFKIKSTFVKTLVLKNLSMQTGINRKGMLAYITKTIANAKALLDRNRSLFIINKNKKAKELNQIDKFNSASKLNFNNFEGRNYTNEQFNDIESKLLGWI